jgi:glycosyltransferase 2 family protein
MLNYFIRLWQSTPWIRLLLKFIVLGLPLYYMIKNIYTNWQILQQHHWNLESSSAIFSGFFLFAGFLLLPLSMRQVMLMLNYELSYSTAYRAYFLSQLSKYLPGGIWIIPGRMIVLGQLGVSGPASSLGAFIEVYMLVLTGFFLFILYSICSANFSVWHLILLLVNGIFLIPLLYRPLLSRLIIHMPWFHSIEFRYDLSLAFQALFVTISFWFLIGTGFFFLVRSVYSMGLEHWPAMIAVYSMAWVAGFLVFIAPGGLGVREGALSLLLSSFVPLPIAAVIALLARVWWSMAEIIFVGIASLSKLKKLIDKNSQGLP